MLMTAVNSRLVIRHEKFKVCSKFAVVHTAFRISELAFYTVDKIVSSKTGHTVTQPDGTLFFLIFTYLWGISH